jgi:hypothetical protein
MQPGLLRYVAGIVDPGYIIFDPDFIDPRSKIYSYRSASTGVSAAAREAG